MTRTSPHTPMRTCVGCHQVDAQGSLVRAVLDGAGRLVVEGPGRGARRLPGRGAYLHPQEKCLITAATRGGFDRSFRRRVSLPESATLRQVLLGPPGAASNEDQE